MLSPTKLNLLKNIANREGITECDIDAEIGSIKGDNYLGVINTITIHDKTKSKPDLNLILKSSLTSEKLRKQTPVRKAYEREIFLYKTVFPLFEQFANEYNISNRFNEIAKCYDTLFDDGEECLIFENLKTIGYQLWDRMVPMDSDHLKLIFKTYGKFHGTSFAFKTIQPERFQELTKDLVNVFEMDTPESQERGMKMFQDCFKNAFKAVTGNEKATNALTQFTKEFPQYMEGIKVNPEKCSVITHGDCWCNNMLFKYEDKENPKKPTDIRLLDWQLSSIGSPVFDLAYVFVASASKETFGDLEEFFTIYYDSLSAIVKQAGCDPETIFSYQDLKEQWRRHCKYGLLLGLMVLKFVLAKSEHAPDLSTLADQDQDIMETLVAGSVFSNEELYMQRLRDVIIYMVDGEFL